MYFGSVKFFKQLICTVLVLWLTSGTVLSVVFGIKYALAVKKLPEEPAQEEVVTQPVMQQELYDDMSLDQLYLLMAANGYSPEEIMTFIKDNEPVAFDEFISGLVTEEAAEDDVEPVMSDSTAIEYTSLFPDLYADAPSEFTTESKVIYLTFDDGPSENTVDILRILEEHNIKATFFMSGCREDEPRKAEIMKSVAEAGHTIGIHSISHDYEAIYSDVESYLEDLNNTYASVYNATGVRPQIIRFAGGSINNYNRLIYPQLIAEVTRRGFVYYDWNVSGEDASPHASWTSIYTNVLNGIEESSTDRAIVLLHDSADKTTTVTTVEDIITALINDGYTFKPLDNTVKPITFSYAD